MPRLPPFVAKLIASDGYENKKYFETERDAIKWALGKGKDEFDGDVERAEIHLEGTGLVWCRDRLKVADDLRYRQMRANPNSLLGLFGIPKKKRPADIEAYCNTCGRLTMNWREYENRYGIPVHKKPLLRCSECYKVVPDDAQGP
jgi:hypothetical protein